MPGHPFRDVAIVASYNTPQAKVLDGETSRSVSLDAAYGVLAEGGVARAEVDGVAAAHPAEVIYAMGLDGCWQGDGLGIRAVLAAACAIAGGVVNVALVTAGGAGTYGPAGSTASWTRPSNEFVALPGLYTAVEFALIARHHMEIFGTPPEALAEVAATIRNNGHVNPEAVHYGRGPYTAEDVLESRMIADPFHLLDCCITSEGGAALLLTTAERAKDLTTEPVFIWGAGVESLGPPYEYPPSWDLKGVKGEVSNGYVGRGAARRMFAMAGLSASDVDCCEFYDPFSFEIIRQFEAFEFVGPGEGAAFVSEGRSVAGRPLPLTTDGGTLSFSHPAGGVQMLQRVVRGVEQLQGRCKSNQVADPGIVMCSNGGAGALFTDALLLGGTKP